MPQSEILTQLHRLIGRWAAAEQAGDTKALKAMLADDFTGIGPHGFQLDKGQWLARYGSRGLVNESFSVSETAVRGYGTAAVATGVQTQQAAYQGHPVDGRFRFSIVLTGSGSLWKIANVQLSPIVTA